MKTISDLKEKIGDCVGSINKYSTKQEITAATNRMKFLNMCLLYIESNSRKEFIESQLSEIESRIENIGSHYEEWKVGRNLTKYRDPYKAYLSEMNLSHFKAQLKTLKFILD